MAINICSVIGGIHPACCQSVHFIQLLTQLLLGTWQPLNYENQEQDISGVFLYIRQKHSPTVESDYSRHPQNSSCSTGTFKTLVFFVDICCGLKTSSPVQN